MPGAVVGSIWVLRHGERADVADPTWLETADRPHDPPLTALGQQQAQATANALANERIDAIYSSPFLRCMQTAAAVARARGLPIRVEPGLGELLNERWFPNGHPVDVSMSDDWLAEAVGEQLIDREYASIYDTPARRGAEVGYELELTFPEPPLEAAARYANTLDVLRHRAADRFFADRSEGAEASPSSGPFALLVTHGFGVQALAESIDGVEVLECDYCALTRLVRHQTEVPQQQSQWEEEETAMASDEWRCEVLCRATHTVGVGTATTV